MRSAALALLAALTASAHAAESDHYRVGTTAELIRVCGAQPSEADYVTAIAFCHGVLAGAYGYYIASTPPADRFVCPPDPPPTRSQVAQRFVAWGKSRPGLMGEGAIDTLFRYAAEAMPCKR
jgi:hypothetical protein